MQRPSLSGLCLLAVLAGSALAPAMFLTAVAARAAKSRRQHLS
jgi:hypothetical protein